MEHHESAACAIDMLLCNVTKHGKHTTQLLLNELSLNEVREKNYSLRFDTERTKRYLTVFFFGHECPHCSHNVLLFDFSVSRI